MPVKYLVAVSAAPAAEQRYAPSMDERVSKDTRFNGKGQMCGVRLAGC